MNKAKLPKWFMNRLHTIMEHNQFSEEMITATECNQRNKWTPVDLILREYYNNGGGSAQGFLGITKAECIRCYYFIRENQTTLHEMDYYNEEGWNNHGFRLWSNYEIY